MILDSVTPAERRLVDDRTGLITAVVRHETLPGMPPAWVGYWTHIARTDVYAPWHADEYGFGAAIGDLGRARRAAVGEAVERYCGNIVPSKLILDSFDGLGSSDRGAIDPQELALYSQKQYSTPGFPFTPLTHDLDVCWVAGTDLHTGQETLAPASLVYLDYFRGDRAHEPATNSLVYAGIAAGATREQAERTALEELFERDATTIWWASGTPASSIADGYVIAERLDDPESAQRPVHFLHVPSAFGVPVVAVLIEDPARGLVAFGSACRADPEAAAEKALVEAFGLLEVAMKLADADSQMWRAMRRDAIGTGRYAAFRPDRRYGDTFRSDFRDMWDLPQVGQLYLDPRMQGQPLDRLRAEEPQTGFADMPSVPDEIARSTYLERVEAAGLRAVSVDLTSPDVAHAGLCVVRVVVPGLYSNAPPAFPLLGGTRLYDVPFQEGWVDAPLTEADLVRVPIPLA